MTDRARRALLGRLIGIAAGAALPAALDAAPQWQASTVKEPWPALLGSWKEERGYRAGRWTAEEGARGVPLPFRAHGVLADPFNTDRCVAIARRPGDSMVRIDVRMGRVVMSVDVEPTRMLNGHAAFSGDGRTLYVTESDLADGTGWVSARDTATLEILALYATRGIDAHAVLVEPGGTLLVANGGVPLPGSAGCSRPETGCMDPSLVRIDARDGRCIGEWRLPDPHLSIRHLARAANGYVGIALQAEHAQPGQQGEAAVFAWFDGASLHVGDKPAGINLRGYGGDVACIEANGSTLFAVSCTRAGVVAWWNDNGDWLGAVPLRNACALTSCGDSLIASGQDSGLLRIRTPGLQADVRETPALEWDNHMVMCSRNS